jgi:hypothetical protein
MNITDRTVENTVNPYGPKFYFLHRDLIKAKIAEIQAQAGVVHPCHVTQWHLRASPDRRSNYLDHSQGRVVRFPNE